MLSVALQSGDVLYIIFVVVGIIIFVLFAHFLPWDEESNESSPEHQNEAQDQTSQL